MSKKVINYASNQQITKHKKSQQQDGTSGLIKTVITQTSSFYDRQKISP